ncbi:MAG TPA: M2 family metallopeptidase, partial [Thermoanaerobaculia bacterium]
MQQTIPSPRTPTIDDASRFVADAETRLSAMNVEQQRAAWVAENFITHDTQILAAQAHEHQINLGVSLAKESAKFDGTGELSLDVRRKLDLIKLSLTSPGPADPSKTAELARIAAEMDATYGVAKWGPLDINTIAKIMRENCDPRRLLEVWEGWHTVAPPMRERYRRFVHLMNEGARELGYRDVGLMWRSKYDMAPDAFGAEVDRL